MAEKKDFRELLDKGLTHYGLGEVSLAVETWHKVLQLDPDNLRAKEYLQFVEVNWAPNQIRDGEPYRPDEGSDPNQAAADLVQVGAAAETESTPEPEIVAEQESTPEPEMLAEPKFEPEPEPPPEPQIEPEISKIEPQPEPSAPVQDGADTKSESSDYTAPGAPVIQASQWGDLYDFGSSPKPTDVQDRPPSPMPQEAASPEPEHVPEPPAELQPEPPAEAKVVATVEAEPEPQHVPEPEPEPGPEPEQEQPSEPETAESVEADPGPRDLQEVLASSTLPPHPDVQPADESEDEQATEAKATELNENEIATKSYDSVPTRVKPVEVDSEAVQETQPEPEPPAPPAVEETGWAQTAWDSNVKEPVPADSPVVEPQAEIEASAAEQNGLDLVEEPAPPPVEEDTGALDLISGTEAQQPESTPEPEQEEEEEEIEEIGALFKGAKDLLELDDFSGALELLSKILEQEPHNFQAKKMYTEAETELTSIYSSKIGDLDQIPRVRMAGDEIIWLNLDHRAGFMLSLIDGQFCFDDILTVCGMNSLDALRIIVQLLQEKVIEVIK